MNFRLAKVALYCALGISASATVAQAANPGALAYSKTTNVSLYAKPTAMLISGRCNADNAAFKSARAKGAEQLVYINPVERPNNHVCDADKKFYMNNYGAVPLWPYPSYGQRYSWPGMKLTDMRPGSKWILSVVAYVEKLMREKKVDGVFLDTTGARLWSSGAKWDSWSTSERNQWTDGNIDLVRRLDAKRKAINPDFIIMNNGTWDRGDSRGYAGEKYVDGVVLEHSKLTTWWKNYAGRKFGSLGQRRVLVIANSPADARAWAKVSGVTHVNYQSSYSSPSSPIGTFKKLNDR
jgi:hypothetical protein